LRASAAGETAPAGYLAALRDARWVAADLDESAAPLNIIARRLFGEAAHCIYAVQIITAGRLLAEARVTIVPQPSGEQA
jgi:hypothetical protein